MNIFNEYIKGVNWNSILNTAFRIFILLIIAKIAVKILHTLIAKFEEKLTKKSVSVGEPLSESEKRIETLTRLLRQAAVILLWTVVGIIILREIGVEIGPIIASAGILGLAVGFGAQNLVRDIISGFFFILENQVRIGDVAIINGTGGLVEQINFRTIVLRDLGGVVHIFPNGSISTVSNLTQDWSAYVFDIGVAYKEDTDKVVALLNAVGEEMIQDEILGPLILEPPEIFGVDKLDDSAVIIKGRIKTKPIKQWQVGREFLRRVKYTFDNNNIEIPFPHRTMYFGDVSKPFDLNMINTMVNKH